MPLSCGMMNGTNWPILKVKMIKTKKKAPKCTTFFFKKEKDVSDHLKKKPTRKQVHGTPSWPVRLP